MRDTSFDFYKAVSVELNPVELRRKFLGALLDLQNVERGSIWVKSEDGYVCIEAAGDQSEKIKGMTVGTDQPSIVGWVIENGRMTVAEAGKDERHYKEAEEDIEIKSRLILCFPLLLRNGRVYGAVQIIDTSSGGDRLNLKREYLELLQQLIDIGSIALSNSLVYTDQVQENLKLRETLHAIRSEEIIIGKSLEFLNVLKRAGDYARSGFPVLISGESGTGKELVAKEIHRRSSRRDGPFLVQNCSAIPDTLLESELFGYRKGAFTGAVKDKTGLFEAANGGTIFLDEIGDMAMQLQARILRVVQENEVKPLGDTRTRRIDVRIVSATNKDLREAIVKELFREDLFYRLNVLPIHIPPLRERPDDIPPLLDHFLKKEAMRLGVPAKRLSRDALEFLVSYSWPGNVRELENFVRHIIIINEGDVITREGLALHFAAIPTILPPAARTAAGVSPKPEAKEEEPAKEAASFFDGYSWEEIERDYVLYLLEKNKWHITRAAREAGVNRSTFDSRMKRLRITK